VVDVKVLDINDQDQRISLSIKDAVEGNNEDRAKKADGEARKDRETFAGDSQEVSQNLGDMFGDLLMQSERK
jgi:predicted RNA-binding protein with RPS1 domain